jgi:hypothetical protein
VCFAELSNHRGLACALEETDSQVATTLELALLGLDGERASEWTYVYENGPAQYTDVVPARIDRDQLRAARFALARDRYVPFTAPSVALAAGQTVTVGAWQLSRTRGVVDHADSGEGSSNTYRETISVACPHGHVDVPLASELQLRYGDPARVAIAVTPVGGDAVVLELDGSWAIEGESGHTRAAQLVPLARVCRGQ